MDNDKRFEIAKKVWIHAIKNNLNSFESISEYISTLDFDEVTKNMVGMNVAANLNEQGFI